MKKNLLANVATAAMFAAVLAPAVALGEGKAVLTVVPEQVTAWVRNFNPFNQTTKLPTTLEFVYEPLIIFNAMQGGKAHYRLAESYSFTDDLKSLTFNLRKGVRWSDGEEFDASDVAFSYDLVKKNKALDISAIWSVIEGYEVIDQHTIKFNLKEANAAAAYKLVSVTVVPEHIWKDVADPVTFKNENPVGTGPLTTVARFTEQVYTQCRNPHYWDAANLDVDCIKMPQLANNDQTLAAAQSGELDWFGSFLPDIDKTYVAKDSDNHKYWFPGGSLVAFTFNLEAKNAGNNKAFNNIKFRRAMSMAMDRDAMVNIAGYGYPTLNDYASGLGRGYHAWNNEEAQAKYGQYSKLNIAAAKSLLEEAGFKDQDGDGKIDNPDGSPIKFNIIVPNGWTDWVNTVQIAVEGLQEIGVDAGVSTPEASAWTQSLIDGNYDGAINYYDTGITPHRQFETAFHSSHKGKSSFQAMRFNDAVLDKALDGFYSTADPKMQRKYMDEIQLIVAKNTPYIPVFNNPNWYQYNTKRFEGFFSADNPYANPVIHSGNPERLLNLLSIKPKK